MSPPKRGSFGRRVRNSESEDLFRCDQGAFAAVPGLAATFRTMGLMWRKDGRAAAILKRAVRWLFRGGRPAEKARGAMSNARLLWPTQEQLRRRYALMDRMMQVRGVDLPAALRADGGLAFIEARAKCRYCLHEEACRRWLTIRAWRRSPDFCPNAARFSCLARARNEGVSPDERTRERSLASRRGWRDRGGLSLNCKPQSSGQLLILR